MVAKYDFLSALLLHYFILNSFLNLNHIFLVILFLHYYYYTYYSHFIDSRSLSCGVWKDGDRHRLYMLSK